MAKQEAHSEMSKQDLKEKFVELRIVGEIFEAIAVKLEVSKQL